MIAAPRCPIATTTHGPWVPHGAAQLKCVLPPLTNPASYRLTFVAASPGAAPLMLKIMQRGAPYHTFWSSRVMPDTARAVHVCDFTLGAVTTLVALVISLGTSGIFDLYTLELVRHTDDDLQAGLAQRYPCGIPANLLRASPAARSRKLWMTEGKSSEHQRDTALYDDTVLKRPDNVALVRDNAALLPLFHAVLLAEGTHKVSLCLCRAARRSAPHTRDGDACRRTRPPPVVLPAITGACYYDIFGNQTPPGVHTAGRVAYIVTDGLSVSNVIAALQP